MFRIPCFSGLLAALLVCLCVCPVAARSIDRTPKPSFILPRMEAFLILEAFDRVAIHKVKDGQMRRTISFDATINRIDVTWDEQFLAVACHDYSVEVWNLETGTRLWRQDRATGHANDLKFSGDGKSLVIADDVGLIVLETQTGKSIATIAGPPETSIMSASLTWDGSQGVFINLGKELFRFEVTSRKWEPLKLTGRWPMRCSADGKYVAFAGAEPGKAQLGIAEMVPGAKRKAFEIGWIRKIKPLPDGSFLLTVDHAGGFHYDPNTDKLECLWKDHYVTDFDPVNLVGIHTDARLRSSLVDLQTGEVLFAIDNNKNYPRRSDFNLWTNLFFPLRWLAVGLMFLVLLWIIKFCSTGSKPTAA